VTLSSTTATSPPQASQRRTTWARLTSSASGSRPQAVALLPWTASRSSLVIARSTPRRTSAGSTARYTSAAGPGSSGSPRARVTQSTVQIPGRSLATESNCFGFGAEVKNVGRLVPRANGDISAACCLLSRKAFPPDAT